MTDLCHLCGEPLDDSRPWQQSLEGGGAHFDCIESLDDPEEEEDV